VWLLLVVFAAQGQGQQDLLHLLPVVVLLLNCQAQVLAALPAVAAAAAPLAQQEHLQEHLLLVGSLALQLVAHADLLAL
jgi:hypothetical protein